MINRIALADRIWKFRDELIDLRMDLGRRLQLDQDPILDAYKIAIDHLASAAIMCERNITTYNIEGELTLALDTLRQVNFAKAQDLGRLMVTCEYTCPPSLHGVCPIYDVTGGMRFVDGEPTDTSTETDLCPICWEPIANKTDVK